MFNRKSPKAKSRRHAKFLVLEAILTPSSLVDTGLDDGPDLPDGVIPLPGDPWDGEVEGAMNGETDLGDNPDFPGSEAEIPDPELTNLGTSDLGENYEEIPYFPTDALIPETSSIEFTSGVFTVGESGDVSIDYLFDGGKYDRGELAIFSLEGMESEPGTREFIQEAARRALSNSEQGYVVISDATDGARFSNTAGTNFNSGEYREPPTLRMRAGDRFGFMLVPNQSIEEAAAGRAWGTVFSMATANPDDNFQFGQIADVTGDGNTFTLEDISLAGGKSDRDYNDIIFQVRGATGDAPLMDDLVAEGQDWRTDEIGIKIIEYVDQVMEQLAIENRGRQVFVGIIDTGFAADNPDLDYDNIQLGSDFVDGDADPLLAEADGNEHGTHIAGIIGATQNNGLGIDGINDDAPLWFGRAIGSGRWADSLMEFVDAAAESGQPNAVVNLSLDLTQVDANGEVTTRYEFTPQERQAIEYARQNGVLLVVSAGNDGGVMSVLGQASQEFDNIITVGAADGTERADYSSYGMGLDLLAEGGTAENPLTSLINDGIGTMAGTSVATAQVTGAVSKVWAMNPELSYRQVIAILKETATDLAAPGWDAETGAGLLNLAAAIQVARETQGEVYDPVDFATPTTWNGKGKVTAQERAVGGTEGVGNNWNDESQRASISRDGNYVVFESFATNVVPGSRDDNSDNADIFVYNRQTKTISQVNLTPNGQQANSYSWGSAISQDGKYVVFMSDASNLVSNDSNRSEDIFLYDRDSQKITRVSVGLNGQEGNHDSRNPIIGGEDGRYVVFESKASNFTSLPDNKSYDIYLHDRITRKTELVSVAHNGQAANDDSENDDSESVAISDDGRYVVFESYASNLVPGDTNGSADIFVRDRLKNTTTRISTGLNGKETDRYSETPAITPDGKYIVFASYASNLVEGDTNYSTDIFLYNNETGKIQRISVNASGVGGNGNSEDPEISANGRYITFASDADNLVPGDTNEQDDIFRYDIQTGEIEIVSITNDGQQGNKYSSAPSISGDGRFITYQSRSGQLVTGDTNDEMDIFIRDMNEKVTLQSTSVDLGAASFNVINPNLQRGGQLDVSFKVENNGIDASKPFRVGFYIFEDADPNSQDWLVGSYEINALAGNSDTGVINAQFTLPSAVHEDWGRFDQFYIGMVVDDTNAISETDENNPVLFEKVDISRPDTGTTERASVSSAGVEANNGSYRPAISGDGRYIVFNSYANNLVPGDTNDALDTFVYDRVNKTTKRVTVSSSGQQGNTPDALGSSWKEASVVDQPSVSGDGQIIAFTAASTNLVPGDTNSHNDIFVHNLTTGKTKRVNVSSSGQQADNHASHPSVSANGRFVAFEQASSETLFPGYWAGLLVHDLATSETLPLQIDVNALNFTGVNNPSISGDGNLVAFSAQIGSRSAETVGTYVHNRQTGVTTKLGETQSQNSVYVDPVISDDGNFVAWRGVIYELPTGKTETVDGTITDISADGRYVSFSSKNNSLVDGDESSSRGDEDVFIYDRLTGKTTLLSVNEQGVHTADGDSTAPAISADGKVVVFEAESSVKLVADDNNGQADIYIREWKDPSFTTGTIDLTSQAFQLNASSLTAGALSQAQVTVRNNGTGDAAPFRVQLYLSKDPNITTQDVAIGSVSVENLATNTSRAVDIPFELPAASDAFWQGAGTYYVGVIIDEANIINETDENNNANQGNLIGSQALTISIPTQGDLLNTHFDLNKTQINPDEKVDVSFEIENRSGVPTKPTRVGFYLSQDANVTTNDYFIHAEDLEILAGNSSTGNRNVTFYLPSKDSGVWNGPGQYYLGMIADDQNLLNESQESNNITVKPITYQGAVNLTGTGFEVVTLGGSKPFSTDLYAGEEFDVKFAVSNTESGSTGPVKVDFYLSEDDTVMPSSDVLLGSTVISSIGANSTFNGTKRLMLPDTNHPEYASGYAGYYIGMVIDPDKQITETDEFDNGLAMHDRGQSLDKDQVFINPNAKDLVSTSFRVEPSSLNAGEDFKVKFDLKNSGSQDTGKFLVSFEVRDENGSHVVALGSKEISNLRAFSQSSYTETLNLPPSHLDLWKGSGNYEIRMRVDALNDVTEVSEANNIDSEQIYINVVEGASDVFPAFRKYFEANSSSLGGVVGNIYAQGNGVLRWDTRNGYMLWNGHKVVGYQVGNGGNGNEGVVPQGSRPFNLGILHGRREESFDNGTVQKDDFIKFVLDDLKGNERHCLQWALRDQATGWDVSLSEAGVEILDANMNPLSPQSPWRPHTNSAAAYNLRGGTYYVKVNPKQDLDYKLVMNLDSAGDQFSHSRDLGQLTGRHEFRDYVGAGDQFGDIYEFEVAHESSVRFAVTEMAAGQDVNVELFRGGSVIEQGIKIPDGRYGTADLNAGQYYVKVTPRNGSKTNYKLALQVVEDLGRFNGRETYRRGLNDQYEEAYYRLTLPRTTDLNVALRNQLGGADIELLRDKGLGILKAEQVRSTNATNASGTRDELNYYQQLPAGDYLIKVKREAGKSFASYDLVLNAGIAETVNLGVLSGRKVEDNQYVGIGQPEHRYTFSLSQDAKVRLALQAPDGNADMRHAHMKLLDRNGNEVDFDQVVRKDKGEDSVVYNKLNGGETYTLVVLRDENNATEYNVVIEPTLIYPDPEFPIGSVDMEAFFAWAKGQKGIKRRDTDNWQGQCVSLIVRYIQDVFWPDNEEIEYKTYGDGKDTARFVASLFSQSFGAYTTEGLPERGAIISFPGPSIEYGHTGIVMESRYYEGRRQVRIMDSNGDLLDEDSIVTEHDWWIDIDGYNRYNGTNGWINPEKTQAYSPIVEDDQPNEEGNNEPETSTDDLFNIGVLGELWGAGNSVDAQNQNDCYSFNIDKRSNVKIDITTHDADASIQILAEGGSIVVAETNTSNKSGQINWILEPGEYQFKVARKNQDTDYALSVSRTPLVGQIENKGLSSRLGGFNDINDPDRLYAEGVTFYRYDSNGTRIYTGIEENKKTILITHGWTDRSDSDNMIPLFKAATNAYSDHQVIALDWREPADDSRDVIGIDVEVPFTDIDVDYHRKGIPYHSARSIAPVADWAKNTLDSLGVKANQLTLMGHSLGSLVSSEIGRLFGGVKNLIALDPAFPWKDYDIDGNKEKRQQVEDFKNVASNSTAFVVSDEYSKADWAGATDGAASAHNSFLVRFNGTEDTLDAAHDLHGGVVSVFASMLNNDQYGLSNYTEDSYTDDGDPERSVHEGVILAKKQNDQWVGDDFKPVPGSKSTTWVV